MSLSRRCSMVVGALLLLSFTAQAGPIHDAAAEGDLEVLNRLLSEDPSLVGSLDDNGRTPLHWACRGVHPEIIKVLVEAGADVNAKDINNVTPLHSVATRGHVEAAMILIENGALLDSPDYERQNALHYAAIRGHAEMVALLVERGADIEARNSRERTPLMLAARESGDTEIARVLIDAGADINAKDKYGEFPLELAAWRGFVDFVDLLLDEGVDVPLEGDRAKWLTRFATQRALVRLFDYMVENGADLSIESETGGSLLHSAAAGGSREIVDLLIEKGMGVDEPDSYGWRPLHHAAEMDRAETIKALVAAGADINSRSLDGKSPLNIARELDRREAADALVSLGADGSPPKFPILEGPYLGQDPPGQEPRIFALGIVSGRHASHSSITFSPDGTEAYWTPMFSRPEAGYGYGTVYYTKIENGRWTLPVEAPFSVEHHADVPFFSPDGKRLYFITDQPVEPGGSESERIWFMEREGDGWSEPRPLETEANTMDIHWQFSLDKEGNLYFGGTSGQDIGSGDIYVSRFADGAYLEPENAGPRVNSEERELSPYIAPDGSYLIFTRLSGGRDMIHISFKDADGAWTEAIPLWPESHGLGGICSMVSPDGRYIFCLSGCEGVEGICWVEAGVIETLRKEALGQ